ncbi:phosphatase [Alkaliphilus transvaalensis]|uniref:phosphatase n=1 Tax=Alkaliphilus transvaalensis TaxID=114628 RepID=UPI00047C8FBD|nr:phosphatase [Alkaliphilus transvaalensis]
MKELIDLHCHTISSGHAYSSMEEMIRQAQNKNLRVIGFSDHGPEMPGSCHLYHFFNLSVVPREINGTIILKGVEANILDYNGTIDIPKEALERLDYAIASLHPPCFKSGTIDENTNAIIKVMENPYVKVIGHPDDSRYPLNYEKVVMAAKKNNVALEVNNSSLRSESFREGAQENIRKFLTLCKNYGVKAILGSDAHISFSVGDFSNCKRIINELNFPEELIVNYSKDAINELLEMEIL